MRVEMIEVPTHDGRCPTRVYTPQGSGPWPAILFYMDGGGIRPAMTEMAERLANSGFVVLLPDLYYRYGSYGPLVPREIFAGDVMAVLGPLMETTGNDKAARDTEALLTFLAGRTDVLGSKVGAVGFCMGGGMALYAAGSSPDRFAAVASFHGGNLASDAPTSPHRLAPKIEAEVYIAAASNDDYFPAAMAVRLSAAFTEAGVQSTMETYPAAHGWMVPDFPVYSPTEAERGWSAMLALFKRQLKTDA